MKFTPRRSRHKEPTQHEQKERPFFSKSTDTPVQAKEVPFFQSKLTIGQPGDQYEQEADAVADAVVNHHGQTPAVQQKEISVIQLTSLATPVEDEKLGTAEARMEKDKLVQEKPEIQRMGAPEEEEPVQMQSMEEEEPVQMQSMEEEEPVQMQSMEEEEPVQMQSMEEEEPVQMQSIEEEEPMQMKKEGGGSTASPHLSSRIQNASGRGAPLPGKTRAEMENAFGVSFKGVNIHTGTDAVQMNQELGAQAFTHGRDVYFNSGKFRPENSEGKHLLAHELTHVVQQGSTSVMKKSEKNNLPNIQKNEGTSWWDTIKKGAGIYLGITLKDEGSAYAKALMRHYVMGGGSEFNPQAQSINFPTDDMWDSFMGSRPEIQRAMFGKFSSLALEKANSGEASGTISTQITGVKLNELESMRWTLHGCHRIDIEGNFTVTTSGTDQYVTFSNMRFAWIDVGDMHPGTVTETDSGEEIDDAELTGAGSSYPIKIPFTMPGSSNWMVKNGTELMRLSGWPNVATAKSKKNRE